MADPGGTPIRLHLGEPDTRGTPLDGGWWPWSTDPAAELPDLVAAIDRIHGSILRIALGARGWAARPKRLVIGDRLIRLGYFESQSPSLLTAVTENGGRVDLLVIAPATRADAAASAMSIAADPDNRRPATQILEAAAARDGGKPIPSAA